MMDWEDEMMKKHAEVVCHNQGDVLEIGFGMGISAKHIQELKPKSHTIMEVHPQILEKLYEWAEGRDNVIIIEGDWIKNLNKLGLYDGIFHDTFLDSSDKMKLTDYLKPGGVFTFFNGIGHNKQYEMIEMNVNPPQNKYFNKKKYYVPIMRK